jgi:hypothetical protein
VQFRQEPQPPARPPAARPGDPAPFRLREPWEIPGLVVEPDDDADRDFYDEDDYADDPDGDYDGHDEEDKDYADAYYPGRAWRGRSPAGHAASGEARRPGGPPLGSYESRRAALALTQRKRRSPLPFVLPALVLAAVGFGGVRLFTARAGEQLSTQGNQRTPVKASSAPAPDASAPSAAGTTALTSFAGYPGQQGRDGGQLAVSSVATGGGQELAVGSADGYPAVWRQWPGSSWSLADLAINGVLGGRPGNQTLDAVTDGPAGWLAVGGVVSGAQQHPVVVTSADGLTWQAADGSAAFGAPGQYTYGTAAGRTDYVIVGEQVTGNTVTPAAWWSAGLGNWSQGSITASGSSQPGEMFAVTVGAEQFIAAGADGGKPAVWTSSNGQQWTVTDLAMPAGMSQAALHKVVSTGTRVVAVGNAETAQGATVAFAEVSNDSGTTWHEAGLSSPAPQAAVTALTASGAGYVAAGQSAKSGTTAAVVWTSPDGMTWAPARAVPGPAGGKVQVIASLTSVNGTASGIGSASTKSGESPVVYTAPAP